MEKQTVGVQIWTEERRRKKAAIKEKPRHFLFQLHEFVFFLVTLEFCVGTLDGNKEAGAAVNQFTWK